jgi:hypothetical protein
MKKYTQKDLEDHNLITNVYDFVRDKFRTPWDPENDSFESCLLSRSQVSEMFRLMSDATGVEKSDLIITFANHYKIPKRGESL